MDILKEKQDNNQSDKVIRHLDVAMVGAGPSNLSLAAHLHPYYDKPFAILDQRAEIHWHAGMMLEDAVLQSSHYKDLIFPSDPRSEFTFLNYLHSRKLLYRYIHAEFRCPLRLEFQSYLRWVAERLSTRIYMNSNVQEINLVNNQFRIEGNNFCFTASTLVLGVGHQPRFPAGVKVFLSEDVFHSSDFVHKRDKAGGFARKRVTVVGAGQSAAEIIRDLISDESALPEEILWLNRSRSYHMFDETVLCNDIYTPSFAQYFFRQDQMTKDHLNKIYKSSSDGIVSDLMLDIFRRMYVLDVLKERKLNYRTRVGQSFSELSKSQDGVYHVHSIHNNVKHTDNCDVVIFATGYEAMKSPLTEQVLAYLEKDDKGSQIINGDYSTKLNRSSSAKLFLQNFSSSTFGWMDPNLGGTSYRSAKIANVILGRDVYSNEDTGTFVDWDCIR